MSFLRLFPMVTLLAAGALRADTDVAQSGPDPIRFDQTATTDNLVVLMAAGAQHNSGLTLYRSGSGNYPKHFWINNWNDNTNDYFKWHVSLANAGDYRVYAKLSSGVVAPLKLSVEGTAETLSFSTRNIGWDRLDAGVISLPVGASKLVLVRDSADTTNLSILSLELIRESDRAAYEQRVADFRSDTTWMSRSKYGLMFQMGPWGYPASGAKKSFEDFTADFDVPEFVAMVKGTGARYAIWSLTWWTYQVCAPLESVDTVLGNGSRTSSRDLIGEIATALKQENIRFMLYYHTGQDSHLGYNSSDWWQAQQFPAAEFTSRGTGDRSVFFNNWEKVVTEVGNRYGNKLDGWFFDDGLVYYPAPFERLGRAAKAGNPNRLISYNPWIAVRHTDFQDVWMGEGYHGESQTGSTPAGGNGVFTDGPLKGLLQHSMFVTEQDWGVHSQNQAITTAVTAAQSIAWVKKAAARGVPLSFDLMMWEDGTCAANSLAVLSALKTAIYGNIVVNGNFEDPVTNNYASYAPGSTALTAWQIASTPPDGVQVGKAGVLGTSNGSQTAQLTGGTKYTTGGKITQTITTVPGQDYQVSVDLASRQGNAITGDFSFGGQHHSLSASVKNYVTSSWEVTASATSTLLELTGTTGSATDQLLIDNVVVAPVPASYSLWKTSNFTAPGESADDSISGPAATPANDGVSNLMKYAFDLAPKSPAVGSRLLVPQPVSEAWALRYQRPSNRPDLTYRVEVSGDLSMWSDEVVSQSRLSIGNGVESWQGNYVGSEARNLFARLRVIQN